MCMCPTETRIVEEEEEEEVEEEEEAEEEELTLKYKVLSITEIYAILQRFKPCIGESLISGWITTINFL